MYRSCLTWSIGSSLLVAAAASCEKVRTATQIHTDRMDEAKSLHGAYMSQMADNAMQRDMAIADHHFVPHTSEISGSGAARLDRMAPHLQAYGGVVRYETYLQDEKLVQQRILHAREYLELAGCNLDRVDVKRMMAGGKGMAAADAIEVMEAGTSRKKDSSGGAAALTPPPMQPTKN